RPGRAAHAADPRLAAGRRRTGRVRAARRRRGAQARVRVRGPRDGAAERSGNGVENVPRSRTDRPGDLPAAVRPAPGLGPAGIRDRREGDRGDAAEFARRLAHERRAGRHGREGRVDSRAIGAGDPGCGGSRLPGRRCRSAPRTRRRVVRHRGERRPWLAGAGPGVRHGPRRTDRAVPGRGVHPVIPPFDDPTQWMIPTACIWEVMSRKVGNVHPNAGFADIDCVSFLLSAAVITPNFGYRKDYQYIGETILECTRPPRAVTGANTNLRILLLLTPLAHPGPRITSDSL